MKKHKEKGINWNGIAKGLGRGLMALDKAGKREADWFFGRDLKQAYEPDRDRMSSFDREADEFFGIKRKKNTDEIEVKA